MSENHRALDRRKWNIVRARALQRDQRRCVLCSAYGRLEVDHIRPLADFPDQDAYALDSLQSLCRKCHFAKTAAEHEARNPTPEYVHRWRALVDST